MLHVFIENNATIITKVVFHKLNTILIITGTFAIKP